MSGVVGFLTYVTVDVKLHICVVRPYDGIYPVNQVLNEEPEAEQCDAEVPALPDEASQEYQQQHCCRQDAGDGIKGICGVDCAGHVVMWSSIAAPI